MKKKKMTVFMAVLSAAAIMLTACGGGGKGGNGTKGAKDTLTVGLTANPITLDPYNTTDSPASKVNKNIHETLVKYDDEMNIVPCLAESWEITDDTTYIFKIRQGVKFHNGEELTAKDVKFSFDMQKDNPHAESVTGMVDFDNCKAVDDYTFELKLKKPFGSILQHLTQAVTSIVNEKTYTENKENYGSKPVGTGPFKFKEWKKDDFVNLAKNDEYWGDKAKVKQLVFRIIPESSTRAIEVESGGVDIATKIAPTEVKRLEKNDKVVVDLTPSFSTQFVGFCLKNDKLQNVKMRQAVNYAIDKEAILNVAYQGIGLVASAPMSPGHWGYDDSLPPFTRDLEKSKKLLEEAGLKDGLSLTLTTDEDQVRRDVAEMVQAQLGEAGIEVKMQTLERGAFIDAVIQGNLELFILGWSDFGTPDYGLAVVNPALKGAGGNMAFYDNPEVEELLAKAQASTDDNERMELYKKVQEISWEESPYVFLQHDTEVTVYSSQLKGFNIKEDGDSDYTKMYFE